MISAVIRSQQGDSEKGDFLFIPYEPDSLPAIILHCFALTGEFGMRSGNVRAALLRVKILRGHVPGG